MSRPSEDTLPVDEPPAYEQTGLLSSEQQNPISHSRNRRESDGSIHSEDSDLVVHGPDEMEQFDIEDPLYDGPASDSRRAGAVGAAAAAAVGARGRQVVNKITTFSNRIFMPVQRFLDPMVETWGGWMATVDRVISKCGNPMVVKRLFYLFAVTAIAFAAVAFGLLPSSKEDFEYGQFHDHFILRQAIRENLSRDSIRNNFEFLTSMPHLAGTAGDIAMSKFIQEEFKNHGFRLIQQTDESAYITYPPDKSDKDGISLCIKDSEECADLGWSRIQNDMNNKLIRPYHLLAVGGDVTGRVVYMNYGHQEDFDAVLGENNQALEGAIVFMKQGGRFTTGQKISLAEKHGAVGAVVFTEKSNIADDYIISDDVAIPVQYPGDILSPGWAASSSKQVVRFKDVHAIPHIPSVPASYADAKIFLDRLNDGHQFSDQIFAYSKENVEAHLVFKPIVRERHPVWDIINRMDGTDQEDKYIVVGASRDSFCYGGVESASSTAVLLEVMRVLAALHRTYDWHPLRTIYFLSWDGTKHNNVGSTEWNELFDRELKQRGALYINIDSVVGEKLNAYGHPALEHGLNTVLQNVFDFENKTSLYNLESDHTLKGYSSTPAWLKSNSLPFIAFNGVSTLNLGYVGHEDVPVSSCFDDESWMKTKGDKDFKYHEKLAETVALLLLKYADEPVIDYDPHLLADYLKKVIDDIENYAKKYGGDSHPLQFGPLEEAIDDLRRVGSMFEKWKIGWQETSAEGESAMLAMHRWTWNTRLVLMDKMMLAMSGSVPHRYWYKHLIFGPQEWQEEGFESFTLPYVRDCIQRQDWPAAQQAIDQTVAGVRSATSITM